MRLPLSVAIQEALMVETSKQRFAIPARFTLDILEVSQADLIGDQNPGIQWQEIYLPVFDLQSLLDDERWSPGREPFEVVVLSSGDLHLGLAVGSVLFREELFVGEINPAVISLPGVGGASVLGDGSVVVILDIEDIFSLSSQRQVQGSLSGVEQ